MKNRDFRPIYGFLSEIIQDRAIVTLELLTGTRIRNLSNGAISNSYLE